MPKSMCGATADAIIDKCFIIIVYLFQLKNLKKII